MVMDETLYKVSEKVKNFAMIWLVDTSEVLDFNKASANLSYSHSKPV